MDAGWKSGQSGNPDGRPSGARNRGSYELRERLKARGGKDRQNFYQTSFLALMLLPNARSPRQVN
jgi:hypothetical protein